jgi:hypothetical protein
VIGAEILAISESPVAVVAAVSSDVETAIASNRFSSSWWPSTLWREISDMFYDMLLE